MFIITTKSGQNIRFYIVKLENVPKIIWKILKPTLINVINKLKLLNNLSDRFANFVVLIFRHGKYLSINIRGKRYWRIIDKRIEGDPISFYIEGYQYILDRETFYRFVLNNAPPYCVIIFMFNNLQIPFIRIDDKFFMTYIFCSKNVFGTKNNKKEEIYAEKWFIDHGFQFQKSGKLVEDFRYIKISKRDEESISTLSSSIILLGQFIKHMADDYFKEKDYIKLSFYIKGSDEAYDEWFKHQFIKLALDLKTGNY